MRASFINNDSAQRAEDEGSRYQFIYRRTPSLILQNIQIHRNSFNDVPGNPLLRRKNRTTNRPTATLSPLSPLSLLNLLSSSPLPRYSALMCNIFNLLWLCLTRAPLGGGAISSPPSRFLAISSEPLQVSPPNLQYPLSQHFYTLC